MPIRSHSVAVCAIVLLCAQAAFVSAAKQIEDADVTLYGVHEPPFSYSLLEQEAAGIHAYHPAKDGEGLPNRPVAAFPFEAPALPTDFPIPREHFQTAPPPAVQRNPYDSSEYARNAALLEQESQIRRGGLRMPYAAAGMAVPRPYLANSAGAAPVMPMQQMAMASPPMMMQQQPQPIYYAAPQPQLTAVAVPIQVPVAPILVEQKASARQEPELNALPAQSTIPLDADSQQETEDIASATADPATEMPEARFAQQAPGSKSMSTDSASSLAAAAQSQSAGAPVAVDSASAGSASIGSSSSGSTPAAPSNRRRKLYKCNPAGTHCKVRFGNDIKWKMVTVPKLPDDGSSKQSQSQSGSQSGSSSAAGSQSGSGSEIQQPQYSDNPEIARLQRAYFEKQQEIARETKWVANVRKIIAEYQEKVRNVARHALVDKQDLRRQEKDIQAAIRKERQAKLEVELRAALESLQKLESTSSALSSKVSDLTNTKLNLRRTISKIQRAMGSNVRANVQDAAASLLEVNGGAAPSSDDSLNEKQDASDNAKQLFSSLLELLEHREKSNAHAEKQDHSHDSHHRSLAHRMLRGRTAEPVEKMSEVDDLKLLETNSAAFDERVHDIASQYADEERQRLDADLPLSTLALRDKHEIEKDLDDI